MIRLIFGLPKLPENASPGEKLRYYQQLNNLSQEALGRQVGCTPGGIVNFEKGLLDIYDEHARKFGDAFGIEPETFLDEYALFCKPGYGKRIRKIRDMYGLSQQGFAHLLGCDRGKLAVWESESRNIHPCRDMYWKIRELAEAIGLDMGKLIENPAQYTDDYAAFIAEDCGKKIHYIRTVYGVSQEEFGKMAGCISGSGAVSLWESGATRPLRKNYAAIKALAEKAGIDIEQLNSDPEAWNAAPTLCQDDYGKFLYSESSRKKGTDINDT